MLAGAVLCASSAWWTVSLPPFSTAATVAVLVAGAAATAAGSLRAPRERRRREVPGVGAWALVVAAGGCWELLAYIQHPRADHPTLSFLANALFDTQAARAAAFVAWLAAGVGLARR